MTFKQKLSLITMATLFTSITFAKTISCPVGVMMATKDLESETKTGKSQIVSIKLNDKNSGESTVKFTSDINEQVEISVMVNSDENLKGLYEIKMVSLVNDERGAMTGFLVKDAGISSGTDWDLGPKGATQLKMLFPNSLSEKAVDAQIFTGVYKILKTKYGMTSAHEDGSTYPIYQTAAEALKKKDLKEGQAIGSVVYMGCWLE